MIFSLALKAFYKAWQDPHEANHFVHGSKPKGEPLDHSHLRLLALLQQSGRLIDFLKEDISHYTDAQVGAAVRKIHEECSKSLEELVTLRPVRDEKEGSIVNIPQNYDPSAIKIVGKVKGKGPFSGILVHKGWKAQKNNLPKNSGKHSSEVIHPAEVEIR